MNERFIDDDGNDDGDEVEGESVADNDDDDVTLSLRPLPPPLLTTHEISFTLVSS